MTNGLKQKSVAITIILVCSHFCQNFELIICITIFMSVFLLKFIMIEHLTLLWGDVLHLKMNAIITEVRFVF